MSTAGCGTANSGTKSPPSLFLFREPLMGEPRYLDGLRHENGGDLEQALRSYAASAARGYAPAYTAMGRFYRRGLGVAADSGRAAEWLRRGVEAGEARAMTLYASMQFKGEG